MSEKRSDDKFKIGLLAISDYYRCHVQLHFTTTPCRFCGQRSADVILDQLPEWRRLGVAVVGGCCRVGPEDIRQLRERVDQINESEKDSTAEIHS